MGNYSPSGQIVVISGRGTYFLEGGVGKNTCACLKMLDSLDCIQAAFYRKPSYWQSRACLAAECPFNQSIDGNDVNLFKQLCHGKEVLGSTSEKQAWLEAGWWFGYHFLFSHILGMSSSQLTHIFSEGWPNHQPEKLFFTLKSTLIDRPWRHWLAQVQVQKFQPRVTWPLWDHSECEWPWRLP